MNETSVYSYSLQSKAAKTRNFCQIYVKTFGLSTGYFFFCRSVHEHGKEMNHSLYNKVIYQHTSTFNHGMIHVFAGTCTVILYYKEELRICVGQTIY